MEFRHQTLDNGLEVIAELHPQAFTASYGVFVNTGARDEALAVSGVSHFLEHMVFKGTARRSAEEINRELDELGAAANAYTSEERTVFHATVLPELQEPMVDLLCDLMQPTLDPEEFDMERQVVLEEISMYDDQPPYGGFERAMELYFGKHPLSQRVLGTAESVGAMSVEQMHQYHRQRYTTGNLCLVGAGQVDFDALVKQAERLSASWAKSPVRRELPKLTRGAGHHQLNHDAAHQKYWIRFAPGPSRQDNERYAMRVLATILGDESGSRLFWELLEPGLVEGVAVFSQEFDDTGLLQGYLCSSPEGFEESVAVFEKVLAGILEDVPSERELFQAQQKICASMALSAERSSNRLFTVGAAWLNRRKWETVDEIIERYRSVTVDDLRRVAEKYLLAEPLTLTIGSGG